MFKISKKIRELAKNVKVADLLAEIELKSAVPAQLLELLNPGTFVRFLFYSKLRQRLENRCFL